MEVTCLYAGNRETKEDHEDKNIRDVAAKVMSKPDQEGLIVRNVVNKDATGARRIILLSSEFPPGKVHLLHRHPNAEADHVRARGLMPGPL
jgi:hypothetical protein